MVRVIVVLSFELKSAKKVAIIRRQMDNTGEGSDRDLNSPIKYALAVAADTVEVAIASRRVAAAPIKARALLENWRR
jgi:hypothetical protein